MSMTKRYLESLPQDEQDAILGPPGEWMEAEYESVPQIFCKPDEQDAIFGGVDNAYISPDRRDEWTESAENEPTEEELAEWARALIEEDDEPRICDCDCHRADSGGLVCSACATNHVDRFKERDQAQLVKPQPKGVKAGPMDV